MKLLRRQAGDTIVEVMIAVAVSSAVLGSAYTITNKSLSNTRLAQEHSEAQKIAQSQLEQIRSIAVRSPATHPIFTTIAPACMDAGTIRGFTATTTLPDMNENNYPAQCRNLGSVSYRTGFRYNAAQNTYTIYVNWTGSTGNDSQVSVVYKVYPGV